MNKTLKRIIKDVKKAVKENSDKEHITVHVCGYSGLHPKYINSILNESVKKIHNCYMQSLVSIERIQEMKNTCEPRWNGGVI